MGLATVDIGAPAGMSVAYTSGPTTDWIVKDSGFVFYATLLPILQAGGAVVGFNFERIFPIKSAVINSEKGKLSLAIPRVFITSLPGEGDLTVGIKLFRATF